MQATVKTKERNPVLDNVKGLGIILVIIGHVSKNPRLCSWIYGFHMPLFFFLCGVMFHLSRKERFIHNKMKSVLVPYFCFGVVSLVYYLLIESRMRATPVNPDLALVLEQCNSLFGNLLGGGNSYTYNVVLWFLPCLFWVEVTLFGFYRLKVGKAGYGMLLCCVAIVAWLYNVFVAYRMPWGCDIALTILPMVMLGNLFHEWYIEYCNKKNVVVDVLLVCIMLPVTFTFILLHQGLDMMKASYPSCLPLLYIVPLGGILLITAVAKQIRWKFLEFVGKNSLIIMCVHEPVKRVVLKVCYMATRMDMEVLRTNKMAVIVVSLITLFATLPIVAIINKKTPWVVGKTAS